MKEYIKILWKWKYGILRSVFFNFAHLPFRQAVRMPIWINKPHLNKVNGKIIIDANNIRPGMIKLGGFGGHMYPNNGFHLTQWGGKIIFRGRCTIGNDSFICQGPQSTIIFGNDFLATSSFKLISYKHVEFREKVIFGFGSLVMDSNVHPLYDMKSNSFKKAYGPVIIGDYNWFAADCKVLHSVVTPEHCIFGLGTIVTKGKHFTPFCVHGGSPLRILSKDVKLDYNHYMVESYSED